MNLRHIEVFHAVYLNGSVVGAARTLNVSQPSVSKVLRHAESQLGFALFRRIRGRLVPTDEAHVLFREINELHGRMLSIRQTAKNLKGGSEGYLRLAVLPALGLAATPTAVAQLTRANPNIHIDIQTLHHDEMLRALIERDSDLAVGFDAPDHPRLGGERIGEGELVLLFRKDGLRDPPERISLSSLQGQQFISLANSGPVGSLFSSETVGRDLDLNERISVRTFYVGAGLVRAGAGVAVVDEFTARASLTDSLGFRPLKPAIRFGVYCIHLVDRPPTPLGRGFIRALCETLNPAAAAEAAA
jgi:DNA-binding transcriptional LysR family regulator